MVKVPGTEAGHPGDPHADRRGINVNITLLFSQQVYAEVAEAYFSGLEACRRRKAVDPHKVASVASFFVSRIDTAVDEQLDEKIAARPTTGARRGCKSSRARSRSPTPSSPISSSKRIFAGERWQRLTQQGAQTAAPAVGAAPAPRTRPTATCSMSTS